MKGQLVEGDRSTLTLRH